ncbi:MAG: YigZ family protein [candidate division KSB1 bacterium]|jgi:uncharacterized YigZ family protein|nr:YigZ family protein [candidate division KSB1 bacterium]
MADYLTIDSICTNEIKIKGSRFIGAASPAATLAEADTYIAAISKDHYNATHNCFAYRIRGGGQIAERCSDDGEPAGTAGQPILGVITGRGISNIAVVVTRYFGGTKLGKGGLVRAYSECTREVLERCRIIRMIEYIAIKIQFPYDMTGAVMHLIEQVGAMVDDSDYGQDVSLDLRVPRAVGDDFKRRLTEVTAGKASY